MRSSAPALLIVGILALTAIARAGIVTISFDQLKSGEDVRNFYNGGFGNAGSGPGPSLGVIFAPGWIAGPPDFYRHPEGKSAAISEITTMNVPDGWSGIVSFYYLGGALVVDFYEEQNGVGPQVGTLNLLAVGEFLPAGNGDLPLFRSAVFRPSSGNRIDALTSGMFVIPEPGTAQLLLLAVGVFSLRALRRWVHSAGYWTSGK